MAQLVIPMMTISVDLVGAIRVVRDTGDAKLNILMSICLPPLSLPIVRFEQALVDGGLLNIVPANELLAKGCNFVIASPVTRAALQTRPEAIRVNSTSDLNFFFWAGKVLLLFNTARSRATGSRRLRWEPVTGIS